MHELNDARVALEGALLALNQVEDPLPQIHTENRVQAHLAAVRLQYAVGGPDIRECAWNILLDLYLHRNIARITVSSACFGSGHSATTGLRHMRQLTDVGLIKREAAPEDARKVYLSLTPVGVALVQRWIAEISRRENRDRIRREGRIGVA